MRRFLLLVGGLLAIVTAVVLLRAASFTSRQVAVVPVPQLELDRDSVAERLAGALRFRTVSSMNPEEVDWEQFRLLHRYLEEKFPLVHRHLKKDVVGGYTLVFTWQGSDPSLLPAVLMSHQDVVPVEPGTEGAWTQPPFEGRIADGFIWGRGSLDDKFGVVGILEAAEILLAQGFQPKRTFLLVFGHDEELGGHNGALQVARDLEARGTRVEFVLDEGGALAKGTIPGVAQPIAMIGTAEKGSVSLALSAKTDGGHSSTPPDHTAVGLVSAAVVNVENHPMPMELRGPTQKMFDYVGVELPFAYRVVLANLWLFQPLVDRVAHGSPPLAATLRTTTAATVIQGGVKDNVLPSSARAVVNFRIRPGDTIEDVVAHTRAAVGDQRITVERFGVAREATEESPADAPSFALLQRSIREVFPDALAAPFLVLGGTDSRHFQIVSDNVYRFAPIEGDASALKRIHGTDERMSVDNYARAVRFFARVLQNAG